jgi:Flp pilus assembly protein TadD
MKLSVIGHAGQGQTMPYSGSEQIKVNAETLFSATSGIQSNYKTLSQGALANGTTLYQKGNYAAAAKEFRRAISLDPSQENAVKAYNLMATAYIRDNKPDEAIKAYKSSIKADPSNDATYVSLGNIYFNQGNYPDALKQYEAAAKISPTSSANAYTLGQGYLETGRYKDAEMQFQKVISISPGQYSGYYGLGQTYSKQGRYEEAVTQFENVLSLKYNFSNARVDLGSAYADLGEIDKANAQVTILKRESSSMASTLSSYITKVTKPKMLAAYSSGGFAPGLGPGTSVSSLDSSLASANASQVFHMTVAFTKQMDKNSVVNPLNWSITKAEAGFSGGAYNWSIASSADIPVSPIPVGVQYDSKTRTATVSFVITQNAAANGTIDPSHVIFKFAGKDIYGNNMDASADQYSGISQIV